MAGAVTAAVLIAAAPAAAQAQAPSYGGGLLSNPSPKVRYSPLLGIVLQPRGGQIAARFDTYIRCGRDDYQIVGRKTVPFDGRSFQARAARQIRIGTGRRNRIVYAWDVRGQVDGTIASGRVRIAGVRVVGGKRTACARKPTRRFRARIQGPAPTGSPAPPPRAGFGGVSDVQLGGGLPAPVILRVTPSGRRILARWNVVGDCGRGPHDDFANYTPSMRIRPDGSFSRAERFSVSYADVFIRYRVRFAGRVSGEYANGTLRARSRIYTANGKRLLTRCNSGLRNWSAAMLRPIAAAPQRASQPTPGTQPSATPTPVTRNPTPGQWSLNMTSDPGDYIGGGRSWSHGPPGDSLQVWASRQGVRFWMRTDAEFEGGWWDTMIAAPPGQDLAVGTYRARRFAEEGFAGFDHGGNGRGCNTITATFTIHELGYDADGTLRRFRADFEQHCEDGIPALRGTWVFNAA